jgi:hypothetical protein
LYAITTFQKKYQIKNKNKWQNPRSNLWNSHLRDDDQTLMDKIHLLTQHAKTSIFIRHVQIKLMCKFKFKRQEDNSLNVWPNERNEKFSKLTFMYIVSGI